MIQLRTKSDIAAAMYIVLGALDNAKRANPMGGIPSGHLYALLMEELDLETYQKIINAAVGSGLCSESLNLLKITEKGTKFFVELHEIYLQTGIYDPVAFSQNTHPFVATPENGKCSSCGKSRTDKIHSY